MRRLLQLATIVLLLAGLVAPMVEFFDQWDAEGISNDTEFSAFALVFVLCLVLLLCRLVSFAALRLGFRELGALPNGSRRAYLRSSLAFIFIVPPLVSPPLRI
jgi:hypothetical protein